MSMKGSDLMSTSEKSVKSTKKGKVFTPKKRKNAIYHPRVILQSKKILFNIPNFRSTWKANIFFIALHKISQDHGAHTHIEVPLEDFRKILNLTGDERRHLRKEVNALASDFGKDVMTVFVEIVKPENHEDDVDTLVSLFDFFGYDRKSDNIIIGISPLIQRYFQGVSTNFMKYPLQEVLSLGVYSQLVYYQLMRFINSPARVKGKTFYRVQWDDFIRNVLHVPKSYLLNNHYIYKIKDKMTEELSPLFSDLDMHVTPKPVLNHPNVKAPAYITITFTKYLGLPKEELLIRDYGTHEDNLEAVKTKHLMDPVNY